VIRRERRESESGAGPASREPALTPKQHAAKTRVLQEAVACIGAVVARSGSCGASAVGPSQILLVLVTSWDAT